MNKNTNSSKHFKNMIFRALKKTEKVYYSFLVLVLCLTAVSVGTPTLISGTQRLFQAVTGWLLILIPVGAGAVLGWQAFQKSLTDDQAIIAEKNKVMKNVIIGAAVAETASGLVTAILSFYK